MSNIDISALRSRREKNNAEIAKTFSAQGQKQSYDDDRYWKMTAGKDGNGAALIRFLDITPELDETLAAPYVLIWEYGFKIDGRWYIERSLKTIGEDDPVYDLNGQLWSQAKGNKQHPAAMQAKRMKRKTTYHSNILVINDQKNPENNGKVFLFQYGPQIYKKIMSKLSPSDEEKAVGAVSCPVFDYWEGNNFRLIMKTEEADFGEGMKPVPNYESSAFDDRPTPIAKTDEEIIAIVKAQYSLSELLDPSIPRNNFKTYDVLKKRLDWVLSGESKKSEPSEEDGGGDDGREETPAEPTPPPVKKKAAGKKAAPVETPPEEDGVEEDATEYLRGLMSK